MSLSYSARHSLLPTGKSARQARIILLSTSDTNKHFLIRARPLQWSYLSDPSDPSNSYPRAPAPVFAARYSMTRRASFLNRAWVCSKKVRIATQK